MSPPSGTALGEEDPARVIHFIPRMRWEDNNSRAADNADMESDSEEDDDDENAEYSLASESQDDDSIIYRLSFFDQNQPPKHSPLARSHGDERKSSTPVRLSSTRLSPSISTPKVPGHGSVTTPGHFGSPRELNSVFTPSIDMEPSFFSSSTNISHRIQSESELRFHRYLDLCEAQQLRRAPPQKHDFNINKEISSSDTTSEPNQQKNQDPKEDRLPTIPESISLSSLGSTIADDYMPFSHPLHLERCLRKRRHHLQGVLRRSPSLSIRTLEFSTRSVSPSSIWPSPSPGRMRNREAGMRWYVPVPAASESGEVWEEVVDEVWDMRDRGVEEEEGDVLTFRACEEDLRDGVKDLLGDVKGGSKGLRRWGRWKKVLKRLLRVKK
ncbi:uncharacterized protein RCC_09839 [Ramularia collo-cygni]|uniref:Uncharacterized protein n=1 Tax=Ramularia collo-cygni TaxID=112498 RepID=A0A2D3VFY8_9PEZI|nr:uncharacterized protein RCC_09839 [Ramularia collo-cygni]CZT24122.1 uncharacterized protein RCC_09839 [Ramularia collo-cygni]